MCKCEECETGDEIARPTLIDESRAARRRLAQAAADAGSPWGLASLAQLEEEDRR